MDRAALVDAAYNAQVHAQVDLPSLSTVQQSAVFLQSLSTERKELVDDAIIQLTELTRSHRERSQGDCFFSAFSMATPNLTGRQYTVEELRQVLADVLLGDDLIAGWEAYRDNEVTDLESQVYYHGNNDPDLAEQLTQRIQQLRGMSRAQYAAYVKTPAHWANDDTLLIFSAFFDIQLVVMTPQGEDGWQARPVKRGSNVDAFIFLDFEFDTNHYDLLLSKVPHLPPMQLEQVSREELTVFTKDTQSVDNYGYVTDFLRDIAVTPVFLSKLAAVE